VNTKQVYQEEINKNQENSRTKMELRGFTVKNPKERACHFISNTEQIQ